MLGKIEGAVRVVPDPVPNRIEKLYGLFPGAMLPSRNTPGIVLNIRVVAIKNARWFEVFGICHVHVRFLRVSKLFYEAGCDYHVY